MILGTTLKTYERDFQAFKAWAKKRLGVKKFSLPLSEALILAYIESRVAPSLLNERAGHAENGDFSDLGPSGASTAATATASDMTNQSENAQAAEQVAYDAPLSPAAIRRHLAAVGYFHKQAGAVNPCRCEAVARLLARIENAAATRTGGGSRAARPGGRTAGSKQGLSQAELEAMLATCRDGLIGLRDRAILLLANSVGGLGRSRLAALRVSDFRRRPDGLTIAPQAVGGTSRRERLLTEKAAEALSEWFRAGRIKDGHAFRVVTARNGVGDGLSDKTIVRIVKRRAEMAGYDPARFGGDSLRMAPPGGGR